MKQKGFTLIELLSTIILAGIIAVIAYPKILDMVEKKEKEIEKSKLELIYSAADSFINNNLDDYPKLIGNRYCFLISELDENSLIPIDIDGYEKKAVNVKIGKTNSYSIIDSECGNNDMTSPILTIGVTSQTSKQITIQAIASDPESEIIKYEYAIDSGDYVDNGNVDTYTYNDVTTGTHTLKVRVTNDADISAESTMQGSTTEITEPIYSINIPGWATSKVVTISYPTRETGFVYTYSLDGGSNWSTVATGTTASLTFNSNGSVIARVYDGINYKTASSYTVSGIDNATPTITSNGDLLVPIGTSGSSPNYFSYSFASNPSGGYVTCNYPNISSITTSPGANVTLICSAVSYAGKSSSSSLNVHTYTYLESWIYNLYSQGLGRLPTYSEISAHVSYYYSFRNAGYDVTYSCKQVKDGFGTCQELALQTLSTEGRVGRYYNIYLGRAVDADGLNYYTTEINSGRLSFDTARNWLRDSQESVNNCNGINLP